MYILVQGGRLGRRLDVLRIPPVPLLWTGVTSSSQARLRMFPCPGSTTTISCRVFPDHLITSITALVRCMTPSGKSSATTFTPHSRPRYVPYAATARTLLGRCVTVAVRHIAPLSFSASLTRSALLRKLRGQAAPCRVG